MTRRSVAAEFARRHAGRIKFAYDPASRRNCWHVWDGAAGDWRPDFGSTVTDLVRRLCSEAAARCASETRARRICSYAFICAVERIARRSPPLAGEPRPVRVRRERRRRQPPLRVIDQRGDWPVYLTEVVPGEPRTVKFWCEHCRRFHMHGWPLGADDVGHRGAHCHTREGLAAHPKGYIVVAPSMSRSATAED